MLGRQTLRTYSGAMTRRWIVAEEHFVVKYDGEAIQDARIDARELGMSLVGLSDLLKAVQQSDHGLQKAAPISLEISARGEGSFWVELIASASGGAWDYAKHMLNDPNTQAILALSGLWGTAQGALRYIAKHGAKEITGSQQIDADTVQINHGDGTNVLVQGDVSISITNQYVRAAAYQAVRPLEREGIDTIDFLADPKGEPEVRVVKDDLPNFEAGTLSEDEPLSDEHEDVWADFKTAAVDGGGDWEFLVDDRRTRMKIEDEEFLSAVRDGRIAFGHGYSARLWVRVERTRKGKRIYSRRFVERVLRVRRPGTAGFLWSSVDMA